MLIDLYWIRLSEMTSANIVEIGRVALITNGPSKPFFIFFSVIIIFF